jgi:hypothetical protein
MKNYRIFVGILALVFGFAACKGPADPVEIKDNTIYLRGSITEADVDAALASGLPLVFEGAVYVATKPLIISRPVTLVGSPALIATGGVVVVANGNYLNGTGTVNAATLIGPASVLERAGTVANAVAPIAASDLTGGVIPSASIVGGYAAVNGDVTLVAAGTAAGQLTASAAPANLIVFGNVTVSNEVSTNLTVSGNITQGVNAVITGAVTTSGNFTSTVTGAAAVSGVLTVGGNAVFKGAAASTGGDLTVKGNLSATDGSMNVGGDLSVAGNYSGTHGALTVAGATSFGGNVDLSGQDAGFIGGVAFAAGTITFESGHALVLAGGGLVIPANTSIAFTFHSIFILDSGTVTVSATSITSIGYGSIGTFDVAQLEALLPKAGAAFLIAGSGALTADATVKAGTTLIVGTGGCLDVGEHKLILTAGAAISWDGKIVAGNTSISGGTNGWSVTGSGASIAISANALTGTGTAPKLLGGATGDAAGNPQILVTAPGGSAGVLTVSNVEIDLYSSSSAGEIVLKGNGTQTAALLLKGGPGTTAGKLTVGSGVGSTVTVGSSTNASNFKIRVGSTTAATDATVTRDGSAAAAGLVVKAGNADAGSGIALGSIAGGTSADADAYIAGPAATANATTLKAGNYVIVPNN